MKRVLTLVSNLAILSAGVLILAGASACKHNDSESVGTATIHSGSTNGVRVTNASAAATTSNPDPIGTPNDTADEFAAALCKHDISCHDATWQLSTETLMTREADCIRDLRDPARLNVEQWTCEPAVARAGFKECLIAIGNESCSSRLVDNGLMLACRPAEICRRGSLSVH